MSSSTHAQGSWRIYRRLNRTAVVALFLFLVSMTVGDVLGNILGIDSMKSMLAVVFLALAYFALAAIRLFRWPCPRCGRPFLENQAPWALSCGSCNLGLYEDI